MAEVESTHSNGKHQLEDAGDAPVKAKLLKTENGSKSNGNGVVKGADENAPAVNADEKGEADAGTAEESNDVLAQTQSDASKHNEESNTNDTNGDGVTSGRAARKVKAGQENSTSAYGDEEEEDDGEDVDDQGDDGEDSDEDDEDDDGDEGHEGDEDDGEDDDDDGEGPEGDDDEDDDDEEDGDE